MSSLGLVASKNVKLKSQLMIILFDLIPATKYLIKSKDELSRNKFDSWFFFYLLFYCEVKK